MTRRILTTSAMVLLCASSAHAITIDGIDFPGGADSFADSVVSFTPGTDVGVGIFDFGDPNNAVGTPDPTRRWTSLGNGGVLTLAFRNNALTTSGDSALDLYIFEIGNSVESFQVEISSDNVNWIDLGLLSGQPTGIDIDSFAAIAPGDSFGFVRLTDSLLDGTTENPIGGADIAGVGAITSVPAVPLGEVPLPAGGMLLLAGLAGLGALRSRRR